MATAQEWLGLATRIEDTNGPNREIDALMLRYVDWKDADHEDGDKTWAESFDKWGLQKSAEMLDRYTCVWRHLPKFTESLEKVTALIEQQFVRAEWSVDNGSVHVGEDLDDVIRSPTATLFQRDPFIDEEVMATTPTLALCAAFCRAMAKL